MREGQPRGQPENCPKLSREEAQGLEESKAAFTARVGGPSGAQWGTQGYRGAQWPD